ncbi:MAG: dTMP kinase [Candidatus Shapirobacteria bacterium]|nr:dTMP kinase [Candidatus Shapirobacteria bacterium]MDD5073814.1 dTMP kinase [Candidatus Shapirobacteria bacterium]MDD5481501.1 dTMP kinase [Candidatus Shapirobacteria bacterium]
MTKKSISGKLVVIEGLDGSGKSTQMALLEQELIKRGSNYCLTREHTRDGAVGKLIERVLSSRGKLDSIALQLLFVADRLDHLERVIRPELDKGKLVICDRYYWATVAYGCLAADKNWLLDLNRYCLEPDLVIYLDVGLEEAMRRIGGRGEKEKIFEKLSQMKQFARGYDWLLGKFPDRSVRVSGEKPAVNVASDIMRVLETKGLI